MLDIPRFEMAGKTRKKIRLIAGSAVSHPCLQASSWPCDPAALRRAIKCCRRTHPNRIARDITYGVSIMKSSLLVKEESERH